MVELVERLAEGKPLHGMSGVAFRDGLAGEVVQALEGAPTLAGCEGLGAADRRGECDVEPFCPIRSPLHRLREGIWRQLEGTSLRSLAQPGFRLPPVPDEDGGDPLRPLSSERASQPTPR